MDYWYKSVQEKLGGNKYVLAVVGSKSDLIEEEEEVVSEEEAKKFAKEKNAIFKLVSSKEDPEGINNLFDTLLGGLIKKNYLNENENENYVITRKNLVNKEKAKKKNRC